jgi:hypothetical protein
MKYIVNLAGGTLASLMLSCASSYLTLAPVGPDPNSPATPGADGRLEVFSALVAHAEGNNPTWYQHRDYTLYDASGKTVEHVDNTVGHYARSPRIISLAPGRYRVQTETQTHRSVMVPVIIQAGRMTTVRLDNT